VTFQFNRNDFGLLSFLTQARALTVTQLAAFQKRERQVVRRRLRALSEEGLIQSDTRAFGKSRGRPEKIIHLTEKGIDLLRSKLPELEDVPNNWLDAPSHHSLDHQLLVNWFRIHLNAVGEIFSQLSVRVISPLFPLPGREPPAANGFIDPLRRKGVKAFAPDLVFSITHNEKKKTLLFFLEADRGTESAAGVSRGKGDIRKKILNYRQCFQTGEYKSYETILDCRLNGFRLLFLTTSSTRLGSLCNLVKSMSSSDFVWLATVDQMFSAGLSAKIWFRGGKQDTAQESILGSEFARSAPLLLKE
jgi:DNA-binding MarR family transcriptional regulator